MGNYNYLDKGKFYDAYSFISTPKISVRNKNVKKHNDFVSYPFYNEMYIKDKVQCNFYCYLEECSSKIGENVYFESDEIGAKRFPMSGYVFSDTTYKNKIGFYEFVLFLMKKKPYYLIHS